MAHHAQDQTETVAMRRLRGSTPIGLAGMSARVCRDGVRLLRPLLAQPRSRLEATLTRAGWPTIEDPSNADPRFERARLRHAAENSLPDEASLHAAGLFRREREEAISIAMVQAVKISPLGYATISVAAAVAPSIALALFSRGARFLNGREYARPPEVFRGVLALSPGQRISLAGCLWQRTKEGWLVASEHAEERSVSGPLLQWNKLFSLEIDAPLPGMVVRGLGPYMSVPRSAHVPYICRRVLPALWRDGVLLAVPHLAPCEGVRVSFQPPRPIIECAFTLALGPKHTM
jgi:tRNA(Ile)-lysidine synthase